MDVNKVNNIKKLVEELNRASFAYYNGKKLLMTDAEFDFKISQLSNMERKYNLVMSNSPTINVGAPVLDGINTVKMKHKPMLSLKKVHSYKEVVDFSKGHSLVSSIKCDGMSTRLIYKDGKLVSANSRGNGIEGSNITEHAKHFTNIPLTINKSGIYIVDGESIIKDVDFKLINEKLSYENRLKNSRNAVAGTLASFDTSVVEQRKISFIVWDVIDGSSSNQFHERLNEALSLGFEVVPYEFIEKIDKDTIQDKISKMFDIATSQGIPNDGIVFRLSNIKYGDSLGCTSHHFLNAVAYKTVAKFYHTKVLDIDWTMGKTGRITPTLIFEPVEIDGTSINKASLHNLTIFKNFKLSHGDRVLIYKANQIIPQVSENLDKDTYLSPEKIPLGVPIKCPICGQRTEVIKENDTEVLVCSNEMCDGKLLGKLKHFASKASMDIVGLSEQTLEKFIDEGFVESFIDIYELKNGFYDDIVKMDGFGKRSADKLMDAIEKSKDVTLDKFINALSIPMVGSSTAKDIAKSCDYDWDIFQGRITHEYDWRSIDGIGKTIADNIWQYMNDNIEMVEELASYMRFQKVEKKNNTVDLSGVTFVITGSVEHFKNRNELKTKIEELGGKVAGSVSSKTDYLINNDNTSNSSKNKKAKELLIPIIAEEEFIKMIQ